jgi:hypothetical protein
MHNLLCKFILSFEVIHELLSAKPTGNYNNYIYYYNCTQYSTILQYDLTTYNLCIWRLLKLVIQILHKQLSRKLFTAVISSSWCTIIGTATGTYPVAAAGPAAVAALHCCSSVVYSVHCVTLQLCTSQCSVFIPLFNTIVAGKYFPPLKGTAHCQQLLQFSFTSRQTILLTADQYKNSNMGTRVPAV